MNKYQSVYYDAQGRPYIALSLPCPDSYKDRLNEKRDTKPSPERGVIVIDMFSDE